MRVGIEGRVRGRLSTLLGVVRHFLWLLAVGTVVPYVLYGAYVYGLELGCVFAVLLWFVGRVVDVFALRLVFVYLRYRLRQFQFLVVCRVVCSCRG